jgi:hypothetical protein
MTCHRITASLSRISESARIGKEKSGLGLDAQRQAVMSYLNGGPKRLPDAVKYESCCGP